MKVLRLNLTGIVRVLVIPNISVELKRGNEVRFAVSALNNFTR